MCSEAALLNLRKIKLLLLGFILAMAANCSTSPQAVPKENMREYVHKNGLTIKLPEKFSAEETGDGFIVEPADGSNRNVRYPIEAQVILKKGEIPPSWENAEEKTVGNRTIKYRINKQTGGSGGAEYNFNAHETIGNDVVYYSQAEQSKDAAPQFNLAWTIIENTSIKK